MANRKNNMPNRLLRVAAKVRRQLRPSVLRFERACRSLGPGSMAIDCGANVGAVTSRLAATGAKVYAFEPNPYAFNVLVQRVSEFSNVECIEKAVGAQAGVLPLYLHQNSGDDAIKWSTGSSLLLGKDNVDGDNFHSVDVIDLPEFIKEIKRPIDLLKIDIEGAEPPLLRRLILEEGYKQIGGIFVETHEDKIVEIRAEMDEVRSLIRQRGVRNIFLDWE